MVRNRCVIEVFGSVFYVVTLLFGLFFGCRGFCNRTESDLFLFLLDTWAAVSIVSLGFYNSLAPSVRPTLRTVKGLK